MNPMSKIIILEPDLEELYIEYTTAQKIPNPQERDERVAEIVLGDPMYGRRVIWVPFYNNKHSTIATMLTEPRVALRYGQKWGIPISKDHHQQRVEYFRDLAKRFNNESDDVVKCANKLYNKHDNLISNDPRDHFPHDVKKRLQFLTYGGFMIELATKTHEFLSDRTDEFLR